MAPLDVQALSTARNVQQFLDVIGIQLPCDPEVMALERFLGYNKKQLRVSCSARATSARDTTPL